MSKPMFQYLKIELDCLRLETTPGANEACGLLSEVLLVNPRLESKPDR